MATLVGYTSGGQFGWVQDGPFYAYLVADETTLWADHRLPIDHVPLGPLSVQPRGRTLRVSISFPVPNHLTPGLYTVTYCNDPCTTGLGDLIGGLMAIGVDPLRQLQREWFLDDPEIANLAADAIITGPGYRVTAGDVQAGRVVEPPAAGSGLGQAPAPDDRPAPPRAEPAPQVVTTVPAEPVATAAGTDLPPEGRNDRPLGTLLVPTISLIAIGAVMGLKRYRSWRLESDYAPTGAGAMPSDITDSERSRGRGVDVGAGVGPR